jgi:hypothetical protein
MEGLMTTEKKTGQLTVGGLLGAVFILGLTLDVVGAVGSHHYVAAANELAEAGMGAGIVYCLTNRKKSPVPQ